MLLCNKWEDLDAARNEATSFLSFLSIGIFDVALEFELRDFVWDWALFSWSSSRWKFSWFTWVGIGDFWMVFIACDLAIEVDQVSRSLSVCWVLIESWVRIPAFWSSHCLLIFLFLIHESISDFSYFFILFFQYKTLQLSQPNFQSNSSNSIRIQINQFFAINRTSKKLKAFLFTKNNR